MPLCNDERRSRVDGTVTSAICRSNVAILNESRLASVASGLAHHFVAISAGSVFSTTSGKPSAITTRARTQRGVFAHSAPPTGGQRSAPHRCRPANVRVVCSIRYGSLIRPASINISSSAISILITRSSSVQDMTDRFPGRQTYSIAAYVTLADAIGNSSAAPGVDLA